MLFQADHVAFSIFPVSSWAEIKAVCSSQLADESVRERGVERRVERDECFLLLLPSFFSLSSSSLRLFTLLLAHSF